MCFSALFLATTMSALDDHDESVRIAARALDDMKKGNRASPCTFVSLS